MDLEMKITVARFIFIEKPLFLSSAPKKKRVSKRKWMSGEIDACGDVHNFTYLVEEPFSDFPPLTLVAYSTNYFTQIW